MSSFQISIAPSRRAAARLIRTVRFDLQRLALASKAAGGPTQSDVARTIGVHRSVINKELRGTSDVSLGRVGELASAWGKRARVIFEDDMPVAGSNTSTISVGAGLVRYEGDALPKPRLAYQDAA